MTDAPWFTVFGRRNLDGEFVPMGTVPGNFESIAVVADTAVAAEDEAVRLYAWMHPRAVNRVVPTVRERTAG